MSDNPILKHLGLSPCDRAVVVHADDLGMCQATIQAASELYEAGLVSSGAVMVPCSWFPAAANMIAERGLDAGVHTTLTCEWESYRWGPISTRDPESGLMAADGCFPRTSEEVQQRARPEAVERELRAQIERALSTGIDVTHIDTHMGAVIPSFVEAYLDLAIEYRVPPMFISPERYLDRDARDALPESVRSAIEEQVRKVEEHAIPVFDHITSLPLDRPEDRIEQAKRQLDALPEGLSIFILHPAQDTPELRAIAPDWRGRVADYRAFGSDELARHVRDAGIHVIGYRELRDAMRSASPV